MYGKVIEGLDLFGYGYAYSGSLLTFWSIVYGQWHGPIIATSVASLWAIVFQTLPCDVGLSTQKPTLVKKFRTLKI